MILSAPRTASILPDLQTGQLRELSGRDPRERIFPVVASIYLGTALLTTGLQAGFGHIAFWVAAGLGAASVAVLEWRVRRFVEVWGDDAGLVVTRAGDFETIAWSDVANLEVPPRAVGPNDRLRASGCGLDAAAPAAWFKWPRSAPE